MHLHIKQVSQSLYMCVHSVPPSSFQVDNSSYAERLLTTDQSIIYQIIPPPKKKFGHILWTRLISSHDVDAFPAKRSNKSEKKGPFKSNVTKGEYPMNKFSTCQSTHVTYLLECPCGLQYVGCATRMLEQADTNNFKKGFQKHSISNHFRLHHNKDPSVVSYCGIDRNERH